MTDRKRFRPYLGHADGKHRWGPKPTEDRIDLDAIERHVRDNAVPNGAVVLMRPEVEALVRAVRAAMAVAFTVDLMTPAGLLAEKHLRDALAPFRKEAGDGV